MTPALSSVYLSICARPMVAGALSAELIVVRYQLYDNKTRKCCTQLLRPLRYTWCATAPPLPLLNVPPSCFVIADILLVMQAVLRGAGAARASASPSASALRLGTMRAMLPALVVMFACLGVHKVRRYTAFFCFFLGAVCSQRCVCNPVCGPNSSEHFGNTFGEGTTTPL